MLFVFASAVAAEPANHVRILNDDVAIAAPNLVPY